MAGLLVGVLALVAIPLTATAAGRLGLLWNRHPEVLYTVDTREPAVALTIDDGPDPETTPRLLEILDRHDARATFFLISERIAGNEALVERMVADGHEIANHLTRDERSIDLAPAAFERELGRAHDTLSRFAGLRWMRPGSGWYDDQMVETAARQGYRVALGTVYPLDAQLPSSWIASRFILWSADPGEVLILHDVGSRGRRTARTLETVLPRLADRGISVVTLSELDDRRE